MELKSKVNCVFCDQLLNEHSNEQLKSCMEKHLRVQGILQSAIGDSSTITEKGSQIK